jgi:acyl-CoA synthetase (AMP-forming)/AMP-acid ligase II
MKMYSHSIWNQLETALMNNSDKELIIDYRDRSLNGGDILNYINVIARDLLKKKIQQGDRVLFLAKPSIESILYFYALTRIGACIVLADPEMGNDNFNSRVRYANIKWMIQDPSLDILVKFSFIKPILKLFKIWYPTNLPIIQENRITIKSLNRLSTLSFEKKDFIIESINESKSLAIIFTSGTTGVPKGVVHSYNSLFNGLDLIKKNISVDLNDTIYASQLYFLLIGLMIPSKIYISKKERFSPSNFLKNIKKYSITTAFLLPYEGQKVYSQLSENRQKLPTELRSIFFGSAPITVNFLKRFKSIISSETSVSAMYGSTEMLIISLMNANDKIEYSTQGDVLGRPLESMNVISNNDNELLVSGPQKFTHYLGKSESEYFESGDLGFVDEDGFIVMTGRKNDMIIKNGVNIYPGIFEKTIRSIPGVVNVAMVGKYNDQKEDEEVFLFIEKNKNISINDILNKLKTGEYSIDSYALPDNILFISELPYGGRSKKVDKKYLRDSLKNL